MALQNRYKKTKTPVISDSKRWLNLKQACEYASIHMHAIRELIRSGTLPKRTVGRGFIVDRLELDRFLESKAA
jgi:excisionase family DNA binding protein